MYKIIDMNSAMNVETNITFPLMDGNRHYEQYKIWLKQGNKPEIHSESTLIIKETEAQQEKWVKEDEEDSLIQPMIAECWSNGEDTVYDADDIPTLTDEEGNPFLDPSYEYIAAKPDDSWEYIPGKGAHWEIVENTQKVREIKAVEILDQIRELRKPLLEEATNAINMMIDGDPKAPNCELDDLKAYRIALRDCTDALKKQDGSPRITTAEVDPETFEFPIKPY